MVTAAAVAVFLQGRTAKSLSGPGGARTAPPAIELRLLHLLPLLFLSMMVLLHGRAVFTISSRHLIVIAGAAALLGAMLLHRLGLEEVSWKTVLSARVLVPLLVVGAAVVFVLAPYRAGELAASELTPVAVRAIESRLVTWLFAGALTAALIAQLPRKLRLWLVVLALVAGCGPGFELTRYSLGRQIAVQRSDRILYPWVAFESELRAAKPRRILVSRELSRDYKMSGKTSTRSRIARLYFGQSQLRVETGDQLEPRWQFAVGSRRDLQRWQPEIESQRRATTFDRSGLLVLVHPPRSAPE